MNDQKVCNLNIPKVGFRSTQSILVVDDSEDTLMLQKLVLESEGFTVFTAQSGGEALAVLGEMNPPSLILLDMQMGDMSGSDFLTTLERIHPEILDEVPVVFHTGLDEIPASRSVGTIFKPTDRNEFMDAIDRFIAMGCRPSFS